MANDDVLRMRATLIDEASPVLKALKAQFGDFGKGVNTSTARK